MAAATTGVAGAAGASTTTGPPTGELEHHPDLVVNHPDHLRSRLGRPTSKGPVGAAAPAAKARSAAQARINATEAQLNKLENQISQEQDALDRADEQYNQSVVELTSTRTALQATEASLNAARSKLETERSQLRDDAVQAYINDTSSTAVAELFAAPTTGSPDPRPLREGGVGGRGRRRGPGAGRPAEAVGHPGQAPLRAEGGDHPTGRRGQGPTECRVRQLPSPRRR